MSKNISKIGSYQCDLIRYVVCGTPVESVDVYHWRMCQKAMGNVFAIFLSCRCEDILWARGVPAKFRSSSIGYRLFSFLSFVETTIEITVGSLDCSSEMAPTEQIGIESATAWMKTLSDLSAQTTCEHNTESSTVVIYQHADHETTIDD